MTVAFVVFYDMDWSIFDTRLCHPWSLKSECNIGIEPADHDQSKYTCVYGNSSSVKSQDMKQNKVHLVES